MRLFSLLVDCAPRLAVSADGGDGYWDLTAPARERGIGARDGLMDLIRAPKAERDGFLSLAGDFDGKAPGDIDERGGALHISARGVRVLPPIPRPGKIVCVGRNYAEHCEEQGAKPPERPMLFSKWPQCVIGPGESIVRPPFVTHLDYEAELAVVIGVEAKNVPRSKALGHVFGYTVANDVTARELQKLDGQWARAKGCDTFCPLGPCVATADAIPDPQRLGIWARVNGEGRQESNTSHMIFHVDALIEFISAAFRLEPGDLILTGTPPGVGVFRNPPALLQPGDNVVVEVEGIGALENAVAAG